MFLYGFDGNFIGSAQSAFLTVLLPPDQLGDTNAFLRTVREGLRLIAPLADAGLFVLVGEHWIAVLDSATFVIASGRSLHSTCARESPPECRRTSCPRSWLGFITSRGPPCFVEWSSLWPLP